MANELAGKKVAFLVANEGVEEIELTDPWEAVTAAGAEAVLIAPKAGSVQAFNHLDKGGTYQATVAAADADVGDFDALVLPGGVANPDRLRTENRAVGFVRAMAEAGRPIAVICHGPWTLIEADVVRDRQLTSWPSVHTDLVNAGAEWLDKEVVVCRNGPGEIVSSRKPDDLPAFDREMLRVFAEHGATV